MGPLISLKMNLFHLEGAVELHLKAIFKPNFFVTEGSKKETNEN